MVRLYDANENEIALPLRWEICDDCGGEGRSSAYLGAYTSSEWEECGEDFQQDYSRGAYDRPCRTCRSTGKVQVVDTDRLSPALLAEYEEAVRSEVEYRQLCEMERRMGC